MKISKLFHWLYAVLMFLPLLVFLPTGFYYAFNDNAQAQEYTKEVPYYYESNEVNSATDIDFNKIYLFTDNVDTSSLNGLGFVAKVNRDLILEQISFSNQNQIEDEDNCYLYIGNGLMTLYFREDPYVYDVDIYAFVTTRSFNVIFQESISNRLSTYLSDNYIYYTESSYNFVRGYTEEIYTMGIVDSMVNAWNHTWELPLFSWSQDTFLNQPFNYITSLFSIPNGSTFANAFGYWLSLSICWLVFDIIMYVPLLVHRWIDKARIE